MTHFKNIQSLDDLKKQYRTLAIKNHPDMGGSTEAMQEVNNEYDILFPVWKRSAHIETKETADSTRTEFYTQNGWKGENYNNNRTLKEIAVIVREYVKKQYPTFKFSVRTEYASMCQELHVRVTEAPFDIYKTKDEWNEDEKLKAWRKEQEWHQEVKFYKDSVITMITDIDDFVKSYNREDCDGMIDYFDVDFYYFGVNTESYKIVSKTPRIGKTNYRDKGITVTDKQTETGTEQPKTAYIYTVTKDTDTRDNSKIYVVKIVNKLSKEEYKTINEQIKTIGGYYSKFKHGFIFKDEPNEALKNLFNFKNQEQQETSETQEIITENQEQNNNIVEGDFNMNNENSTQPEQDNKPNIENDEQPTEQETITDIFSKFDNIEIENSKRIDDTDQQFCEDQQERYDSAIDTLNQINDVIKTNLNLDLTDKNSYQHTSNNESYLNWYKFKDIPEVWGDCKEHFIHQIIGHFTEKYHITIDSYKVSEKYKEKEVNYNILLDEIFEQLGGFSFSEMAVKEIKDNMKKQIRCCKQYWKDEEESYNMSIKNSKLIFDDLIYASKNYNGESEFCGDKFKPLAKALSHFSNGSTNIAFILQDYCNYTVKSWAFEKRDLSNIQKLKSIKIYKNNKVEVEFATFQQARQFALEYCGYNPDIAPQKATA